MKITKKWLQKIRACKEGVDAFDERELTTPTDCVKECIKIDKLDWANWLIVRCMKYKQYVSYAVFAAEQVIGIYEKKYPTDQRPRQAIESAKACLINPSKTNKDAAYAAYAAYAADAAYAAYTADAAYAAAAYDAAYAAYAAYAADAAYAAAYDAAYAAYAAYTAVARKEIQLKILNYGISLLEDT